MAFLLFTLQVRVRKYNSCLNNMAYVIETFNRRYNRLFDVIIF